MLGGIGSDPMLRPAYPASIVLRNRDQLHFMFCDVAMLENNSQLGGADILIGMDIISRGETAIRRINGDLMFSFREG